MGERVAEDERPVVLFDGVCNLCNGAVQWLLERDPEGRLTYASLQSPPGGALLEDCGFEDALAGIVVVDRAGCHRKSDAVLRIASHLGWPYRAATPLRFLPRVLRDPFYDFVANRRYRWFGTREACMMPTPELRDRFLEDGMYPPPEQQES